MYSKKRQERTTELLRVFEEELMQVVWHPKNITKEWFEEERLE